MPSGKKNVQRTKGNTRPSSSGRSAQKLLQTSAEHELSLGKGSHLGFVGLTSSSIAKDDLESTLLDDNCRVLLKKMTKKDATTKLKALQEFKSYCVNCSDESFLSVLPYWPRFFNKLCLDNERRIREATNLTQAQIIDRAKKNFAPHLKNVIGYWMLTMNDSYAPASSAAQLAFEKAFSSAKQIEVLVFCKDEIMKLIIENLFHLTPQSLRDSEVTSADELQENYLRILTCTMFAFANLIEKLPHSENENLISTYEVVISNNQFWKLASHDALLVKGAWLKIISAFTKSSCLTIVLSPFLNKLIVTVFANLDESDPVVSSAAWDATLQLISTFKDCWSFINVKKLILPKLWKILKQGCFGNASVISSCLLPFMSELMRQVESSSLELFYDNYFNSCIEGLLLRSVRSSIAEFSSLTISFFECLKYVMLELMKSNSLLVSKLLNVKLFSIVETLLTSPAAFKHNVTIFSNSLIKFLSFIHLQSSTPSDVDGEFQRIENEFWNLLDDCCLPILTEYEKVDAIAIENLSCLLKSFSRCGQNSTEYKIQRRIRFEEVTTLRSLDANLKEERSTDPLIIYFGSPLNQFIGQCCVKSLLGYSSKRSLIHLQFLTGVLFANPHSWLIRHLIITERPEVVVIEEKICLTFYFEILKSFIINEKRKEESSALFASLFLTITNILQDYDDMLTILKDVCLFTDNVILLEILTRQLLNSALPETVYKKWITSEGLNDAATNCARSLFIPTQMVKFERDSTWKFLTLFVKECVEKEWKIAEQLTWHIVNELLELSLRRKGKNCKKKFDCNEMIFEELDLVYELLVTYLEPIERSNSNANRILFVLFQIVSHQALDESFISGSSMESFRSLLINKGFSSFFLGIEKGEEMKMENLECLKKCADFIKNLVLHSTGTLHPKQIKSLRSWQQMWLKSVAKGTTTASFTSWDILLALLPTKGEWDKILNQLFSLVPLKVLFNLKQPWNTELKIKSELKNSNSILAVADFILDLFEIFSPQSYSEEFVDSFMGLSAVTGYCKLGLSEEASVDENANQVCKNWLDRISLHFWPGVMKTCVSKVLILQNVKLAENSHHVWTESLSILLNAFQEANSNWPEFLHDDLIANSYNLLEACLPLKPQLSKEFCFVLMENLKQSLENAPTIITEVNDQVIKLSICLRNLSTIIIEEPELTANLNNVISLFRQNKYLTINNLKDKKYLTEVSTLLVLLEVVLKLNIDLNSEVWDFILCTLGTWIKICCEELGTIASPLDILCMSLNVFSLLEVVSSKMKSFDEKEMDNKLIVEWKEFYCDRYYQPILNLFLFLSTNSCEIVNDCVLENLVKCLQNIPLSVLEDNCLQPKLVSSWDEEDKVIPLKVKYLLNSFSPLLMSDRREFRFGAYLILKQFASAFPRYLQQENLQLTSSDYDDDSSTARYLPGALMDILHRGSVALSNHNFEELNNLKPKSKLYYSTHGYLLSACLLFNIIGSGPSEWKTRWASFLRTNNILYRLTNHLFLIIQEEIQDGFTKEPSWYIKHASLRRELENLASYVYMEAVRRLPVLVREWWNSLDRKAASYVDRITSRYITPKIISKDFQIVTEVKKLDNLVLLARPIVREVIATYTVEEVSFELSIQLADNHPLGPVNIQCNRCVGVAKSQWNFWMLQLTTSITQRNGSILDALVLWKCHVDKMFEGVEECFVCYTILGANFQLPKLGCNTCKKKFHSSCLFKWFNTSGHSTCPLCRSIF